ncbi:cutinase family protein [Mycobacterium sp. HUMS_1102779]|uniref:cutinase family protein n=1 Tax=Mycobacterium sp. HUMS_1102779 TaxID=3383487 RepID=UPI003899A9CB
MKLLSVAALAACGLLGTPVPSASAASCPATQVLFARGTGEPPGVGPVGEAFVNQLRSRVGANALGVYAVKYPASDQWDTGIDGVRDAGAHVVSMAKECPNTKMVLSGYSQGAAVMGFVTSPTVPDGVDPATVPKPLAPDIAQHVSSVVLFGLPNERAMSFLGEPPVTIGPLYQPKTLELCADNDPVCSEGLDFAMHNVSAYQDGMVTRGADYAASHL